MPTNPNKLSRFWQELKRRKVLYFLIGYVAACFAIIEFFDITSGRFTIPDKTFTLLYVLGGIGLPIVIILPWFIYGKQDDGDKDDLTSDFKTPAQEKSIVVLPFENISPDPDQEYFSDGLTEEIITDLSHINDLLVISRSSAMTFKGTNKKIREIASDVNVRFVLEGSVRKEGDNLRITAQLIDSINDAHIWAEKYKGTLNNVFEIQEKVSKSIAETIGIKIFSDTFKHKSGQAIKDPIVYELYLKARYENWQFNEQSLDKAEELLNQGLKVVGDNELFYSELCHSNVQHVNQLNKNPDQNSELLDKAKQYADKAIQISAESASAYYAQGLAFHQSGNPYGAINSFRKAILIEPNHSESGLFLMLGYHYAATGFNQAETNILFEKAKRMDPMSLLIKGGHGWSRMFVGNFQESVDEMNEWKQSLEKVNSPFVIVPAWIHGLNQDFQEAFRLIDQLVNNNPKHILSSLGLFMKYSWLKEKQKAIKEMNGTLEKAAWWDDTYSLIMAECYSLLEEKEIAFRWLNHAIDYGITNIPFLTNHDPFLTNLKSDIKFEQSITKASRFIKRLESL